MTFSIEDRDVFDLADEPSRAPLGMVYKVIVVTYNALTGDTLRKTYPASSMEEAEAIEAATDPENARERVVTIVPDAIEYLRLHYPEALQRLRDSRD